MAPLVSVHTKPRCSYVLDASLTLCPKQSHASKASAAGAAGTEQDWEYNTLLESDFSWKVCLFL